MSNVLITGGGGSLGSEIALLLSGEGHRINVFDLPGLDYSPLENKQGIEIYTGNITDIRGIGVSSACGLETDHPAA